MSKNTEGMKPSVSTFMGNPMIRDELKLGGWTSMVHGNNFFIELAEANPQELFSFVRPLNPA
jgi:hypothetical protein